MFPEDIEAWEHGPVCRELYNRYSRYGGMPIFTNHKLDTILAKFTPEQIEVLEQVQECFGCLTSYYLRELAHSDPAWINARMKGGDDISLEEMKQSCKDRIIADDDENEEEG